MTIGELARRTGVSTSCLRFYERVGLLHPERSRGNQRRYPAETVELVEFIQAARCAELPISLIAQVLHMPGTDQEAFGLDEFYDELRIRTRALNKVRRDVERVAGMCSPEQQ